MKRSNIRDSFAKLFHRVANIRYQRDFYIFLVFVAVSSFIWLSIKLSEEYSREFDFRIKVQTSEADQYILSSGSDSNLKLKIKASGFALLKLSFVERNKEAILQVNTNELVFRPKDSLFHASFHRSKIINLLISENDIKIESLNIQSDSLYFVFDELITKELRVVPIYKITYKDQFAQSGTIKVLPEMISIIGPRKELDNMSFIPTELLEISDLSQDVMTSLPLDANYLNDRFQTKIKEVDVEIPVSEFLVTTYNIDIDVETENAKAVKLFPSQVSVNCMVAIDHYQQINEGMFKAVVHIDPNNSSSVAEVQLKSFPNHIRSVTIEPNQVEFIFLDHD